MKIESLKAGALWHEKLCAEHLGKSSRVETEGNHLIRSNTAVQRLLENKEAKSWSLELYHDAFKNNSMITSKYRKEKLHACIWLLNNKNGFEKKKKRHKLGRPSILWISCNSVSLQRKPKVEFLQSCIVEANRSLITHFCRNWQCLGQRWALLKISHLLFKFWTKWITSQISFCCTCCLPPAGGE